MNTIEIAKACREIRAEFKKLPRRHAKMTYEEMKPYRDIIDKAEKKYKTRKGFLYILLQEDSLHRIIAHRNKYVSLDWLDDKFKIKEVYKLERL